MSKSHFNVPVLAESKTQGLSNLFNMCSTASLISLPTEPDYSNIPLEGHTRPVGRVKPFRLPWSTCLKYALRTTEDQPGNLKLSCAN